MKINIPTPVFQGFLPEWIIVMIWFIITVGYLIFISEVVDSKYISIELNE